MLNARNLDSSIDVINDKKLDNSNYFQYIFIIRV